jgi:hypothetical protein
MSFTIQPSIEPEYFALANEVRARAKKLVHERIGLWVEIAPHSAISVLFRILNQRREPYTLMVTRSVMELAAEIIDYHVQRRKQLKWAETFDDTQRIYNASAKMGPDTQLIKSSKQYTPLEHYFHFAWQGGG